VTTGPILRCAVAALALVVGACGSGGPAGLGPDVRRGLDAGREAAAGWIADGRSLDDVSPQTAIALGYLERLRIGLGSPFRLAEQALEDPRLGAETRHALVWAILARTLDRSAYQLDEAALDRAGYIGIDGPAPGRLHAELIESAIREARDPRSGELAVRLAYAMAAAEGTLVSRAPELAAGAAALVRDRELARTDVLRLLRAAEAASADPLALLPVWRAQRSFAVEAPPLAPLSTAAELEALDVAPRLSRAVRNVGPRVAAGIPPRTRAQSALPLLGAAAARRLLDESERLDAPPQTPIVIAVRAHRREITERLTISPVERQVRTALVDAATSEERFAAVHALLRRRAPGEAAPALAALAAAVAMRTYAQEPVWFPGMGGPTGRDLEERYGLAAVRFDDDVPAAWRPYYRRMLDLALTDLLRVLPAVDLRGLTVVFGGEPDMGEATLALHDPRRRRLILPTTTAAGTLAHEVAHDLDWQVALRRYRVRGDYATDRAARAPNDRLAARVQDLANASLEPWSADERFAAHARRPAEVFARNVDWLVAASLAGQGRTNGYLSSVQDDLLTGYGTVRPPDISGAAGEALVTILDEVAPLYPATRDGFLRGYGANRVLTPYDLARRVLEPAGSAAASAVPLAPEAAVALRLAPIERAREAAFHAIDAWTCRAPVAAYHQGVEAARRRLVAEAAAARARGAALGLARSMAGEAGQRWMLHQLHGAPWPVVDLDAALTDALRPITGMVRAVAQAEVPEARTRGFVLSAPPGHCAGRVPGVP
jgi:hypothetical protein